MKAYRYIEKYLIYAFPAVIICIIWSNTVPEQQITMPLRILWEVLAWNLMVWFVLLSVFVLSLLIIPSVRENFFKKIASIKERDEREEQIVGAVTKRIYISTLSVLVFLFFISTFSFNVRKVPPEQQLNGKSGTASINFNMKFWDEPREKQDSDGITIVESKDLPLTKSAILLLLILWQLIAYRFFFWREAHVHDQAT